MQQQYWCALLLLTALSAAVSQVSSQAVPSKVTRSEESTLVVYSYRQSDPEALGNFQHFLDNIISPLDQARYIIVVDHGSPQQHGHMSLAGLPRLPTNAQYLSIRDCYELGHVGKVLLGLSSKHVATEQYDYFVWLDSSAKSSVFPTTGAQGDRAEPWHIQLTSRITSTTKLVGASISCEPVALQQNADMLVPHVQSTIMATDKVGLKVLQRAKCFDCYSTWHEAKMKGEVAASSAMLKASYNLDSFLPPYQNVNWQDKRSWPCAATHQPHGHPDPGSAAGLLTNIVEKFRTGSRAKGSVIPQPQDDTWLADDTPNGLPDAAEAKENLVEKLLEATGDVKPDALPHTRAASGSLLLVEVPCDILATEPEERQDEEAADFSKVLAAQIADADAAQGYELVFYGDSILALMEPIWGQLAASTREFFGEYSLTIQAVPGDQSAHLFWRTLHGGVLQRHPPKLSVVMIGANDLEDAASCARGTAIIDAAVPGTVMRVESIVEHLLRVNPDTPVLLLAILAMADVAEPDENGVFPWPNKYTPATHALNQALELMASRHDGLHYADCHAALLSGGIQQAVMEDGIHPTDHGMNLLAQCMAPEIHRLAGPGASG